ncbi:MAG: class D beta-lactamase [Bacteroidota bacterium]
MRLPILFVIAICLLSTFFSCSVIRRDSLHPEWQAEFDSLGVRGGIIVFDESGKEMHIHNPGRMDSAFMPASTFKIPNSLIALQTGAVKDTSEIVKWDSVVRFFPPWNQDHNMASALPVSAVWFYQEMARRIGRDSMKHYLDLIRYGNRDTTDIDMFWLNNSLQITAREQIYFLEKVYHEQLPFKKEHIRAVKKLLFLEKGDDYVLRGKTGWGTEVDPDIGWLVGWLEKGEDIYYFACNIDIIDDKDVSARKKIVRRILGRMGLM